MLKVRKGVGRFLLLLVALILVPSCAPARTELSQGKFGKLEKDETWTETVSLSGDLYIPADRTLVVQSGSVINVTAGKSLWDVDLSRNIGGENREITRRGLVDIIVEGTLRMEGRWLSGISVADSNERRPSSWGGIVLINNGKAEINRASVYLADTAMALFDQSEAKITHSTFKSNLAAIEAFQESSLDIGDSTLSANPTGAALYDRARGRIKDSWFRFNSSGILIADQARASVESNILFKNILAISALDSSKPQVLGNYLLANQTGIRLGQSADPDMNGNWSFLEKNKLTDERDR